MAWTSGEDRCALDVDVRDGSMDITDSAWYKATPDPRNPDFTWANRETGPMREWLPIAREQ